MGKGVDKSDGLRSINTQLERLETGRWMCEYFDKITELCRSLTAYAMDENFSLNEGRSITGVTRSQSQSNNVDAAQGKQKLMIITGGGPGFMEAVRRHFSSLEYTYDFIIGK